MLYVTSLLYMGNKCVLKVELTFWLGEEGVWIVMQVIIVHYFPAFGSLARGIQIIQTFATKIKEGPDRSLLKIDR